ncbi:hypothetical protein XH87_07490 [Bradyrhizobium sp. CCBAU 53415]|nr:hypothetical protein [Bradyrhizobium sp. CCBAU 53415]
MVPPLVGAVLGGEERGVKEGAAMTGVRRSSDPTSSVSSRTSEAQIHNPREQFGDDSFGTSTNRNR